MWQKANPIWFRVGITKSWQSERIAKDKKQSQQFFVEDILIRRFAEEYFGRSWISKVVIKKTNKEWEILLFTAKAWIIMWKNWEKIKDFETKLSHKFKKEFKVSIKDVKNPEMSAKIMAEYIATQIEWRLPFRRVAKSVIEKVMSKWAMWIKISMWWRLWWVDIARSEKFVEWRIPLQTLRTDVDFHQIQASTKYGVIWISVRIWKHNIQNKQKTTQTQKIDIDKILN